MFTLETKSQLAKLLASENITVEHKQTTTAYFELKSRTLVCPIWKNMTGALYDLLMGHEVGHALYTPQQGWHDAIKTEYPKSNFKSFLNVLEDARIEKKMKRKFPGLVLSFTQGYQKLRADNFFGVKDKKISTLPLIDRLNLLAKGGNLLECRFSSEEDVYVKRMESLETWAEVVQLAKELYERAKELEEEQQSQMTEMDELLDNYDDTQSDNMDTENSSDDTESSDMDDEDLESSVSVWDEDNEDSEDEKKIDPTSLTDDYFRQKQVNLLSDESLQLQYLTIPTPNLKACVYTETETLNDLKSYYRIDQFRLEALYAQFMEKHNAYVSLLAKEFEQHKAAAIYKKSKHADTGDLNVNKLYRYKLLDDVIFKKRMKIYKGKSHGIVLLLDKSGSMHNMISESIEQLLILALFCRKVRIPFAAYSFQNYTDTQENRWTYKPGDLVMDSSFCLRQIITSDTPADQFRETMMYHLKMSEGYRVNNVPSAERLGGTPLNEALVVMESIIQRFRHRYKIDLAHLILLHDGQSQGNGYYMNERTEREYLSSQEKLVIRDKESLMTWRVQDPRNALTSMLLEWLQYRTGVNVFGMYLIPGGRRGNHCLENAMATFGVTRHGGFLNRVDIENAKKQLSDDKYYESFATGYSRFSYIRFDRADADDKFDAMSGVGVSKAKISTAFVKMFRQKGLNRVMAKKFIPLLAEGIR